MASSDKSDNANKAKSAKTDAARPANPDTKNLDTPKSVASQPIGTPAPIADKQASTKSVVESKPVDTAGITSPEPERAEPVTSGLVGRSDGTPPAGRKQTASPSQSAAETSSAKPLKSSAGTPASETGSPKARPGSRQTSGGGGFWPLALGGVVAAGLGAGAAIYALPHMPASWRGNDGPAFDVSEVRADAISEARDAARSEVGDLRQSVLDAATQAGTEAAQTALADAGTAAQSGSQAQPAIPPEVETLLQQHSDQIGALEKSVAAARRAVDTQSADRAAQNGTAAASAQASDAQGSGDKQDSGDAQGSENAPASGSQQASTTAGSELLSQVESLQKQVEQQGKTISDLSARPQLDADAVDQIRSLAENANQVKSEIDSAAQDARKQFDAVQSEADAATQRAQAVASVAALGAALERGDSAAASVEQLRNAGVEIPDQLAQEDIPTLDEIQTGYDAAARAALRASLKAGSKDRGAVGAVSSFLRVQTGARSVEPRDGDDADAILSRSGVLVAQGDLTAALEELKALPEAGQVAMADWTAKAETYLAAEAALNDVAKSLK